ncbi:photoreceptor outer segment membrane glycoprotein 2-like [Mya arenaria]|uniref:photoreceptor outer segment membrane glycoprotein 2-like n=1 Tax=Mya arenaria TaxID=6604 RepID=UPI0022E19D89|nr:photoreceptor outer segment membrane glycoprotein 2-like [Mya arenaria]
MVFPITFSEIGRNKLAIVSAILCALLALSGLCLICVGLYIQVTINDELILLENYNDGMLPNFLISVGVIMIILNTVTAKFAYDSGFASTSEKYRLAMMPMLVVMFLFIWIILAASIISFAHRSSVEDALHDGIKDAMRRYKNTLPVKKSLDRLQMDVRCCGSRSFKDWFKIGWINMDYVNVKDPKLKPLIRDKNIFTQSVPFSCCDVTARRPCVTADVLNHAAHRNYDSVTLYRKGCTEALMDKFQNKILHPTGSVVLILFAAQTLLLMLLRYLQTSVQSAYDEGDPEGPGRGHVIPNPCGALSAGDPDKYVKQGALQKMRREPVPDEVTDDTYDSIVDIDDTMDSTAAQAGGEGYPGPQGPPDFGDGGDGKKKKKKSKSPKKAAKRKSPKRKSPPKKKKSPKSPKSSKKKSKSSKRKKR